MKGEAERGTTKRELQIELTVAALESMGRRTDDGRGKCPNLFVAADCHVACFLCVIGIYCRSVGWRKGHVKWTSQRGAPGRAAFEPDIIDIGIQSGFSINLRNRKTKRPMQWQQPTVDQNPFCQAPRRRAGRNELINPPPPPPPCHTHLVCCMKRHSARAHPSTVANCSENEVIQPSEHT